MTEYTSSPEAVREYMSAKERTAWWIRHQSPADRCSPSAPPSDRGDPDTDAQSYTVFDSDGESTHSVPPKMLLKYNDGRPDIPISHWHHEQNKEPLSHSDPKRDQSHRRSRSEQPILRTNSHHIQPRDTVSRYPEEIRILPSKSSSAPRSVSSPNHRRSKSQPRHGYSPPREPAPPLPLYPSAQHTPQSVHTPMPRPANQTITQPRAPQVAYSQSHPMYLQKDPYASRYSENLPHRSRTPPSIVYAPGSHSKNHYAPPALIHHQHGTPVPRYPYTGGTPFPSAHGGLASVNENRNSGTPRSGTPRSARTRGHTGAPLQDSRSPSPSSRDSGSTYYVLPTPGQKVQIIAPDRSMYTATSTTQSPSPTSPTSPTHSGTGKKPFFSRFFNIAEKLASVDTYSRTSSSSSRRLQRRHSLGASSKGRPPIPIPPR